MSLEETTDFIFLEDKNPRGDIAIVFGMWKDWRNALVRAVKLYKNNKVSWVLLSQGVNPRTQENEGDKMAEEILKLGMPKDQLLLENKSTNTLENVLFSKTLINDKIGLNNVKSVVAVCANFHARRVAMTLSKHFPSDIEIKISPYVYSCVGVTKANWHKTEKGKDIVNREIEKIKIYLAKGDIADL